MRKLAVIAAILIVLLCLAPAAAAAPAASQLGCTVGVASDGTCQFSITATVSPDQSGTQLVFPLPKDAYNVSLNGTRVRTQLLGDVRIIDLSDVLGSVLGSFSVNIQYSLSGVITETETGTLELRLPLLSGFAYPVESMSFSITLPAALSVKPAFSSGYHQTSIEEDLSFTVEGATVTGHTLNALKDHETLTMLVTVPREMFPSLRTRAESTVADDIAMGVLGGLALLYWLLCLRCAPARGRSCPTPPEGCNAGQAGAVISLRGTRLTLMVLTWAQLGYVLIRLNSRGHAVILKRMDMGNERSGFEQRCFQKLFRRRNDVDTSGFAYAQLCKAVSRQTPYLQPLLKPRSGNPLVFRLLLALLGACGGISAGIALSGSAALAVLIAAMCGAVYGLLCWLVQDWAGALFLDHKKPLWLALLGCAGLLLGGAVSGQWIISLILVGTQLLGGVMAAFGGRRTALGKQMRRNLLGLRRYMKTVSPVELQRIADENPDYFFTLMPFALAMGVEKAFTARFGKVRRFSCHWLDTGRPEEMTAAHWGTLLRDLVKAMDARYEQLGSEKLLRVFRR